MKERFRKFMFMISALGIFILAFTRLFGANMNQFTLGFCEGISVLFIVVWGIYMLYSVFKGENPYNLN